MAMNSLKIASHTAVLLVVLLSNVQAKRNFNIFLEHCNCTINPIYFDPCICHIDKTVNPPQGFMHMQLHRQVNQCNMSFDVYLLRKDNEKFGLFNATDIDTCSLMDKDEKAVKPLLRMLREVFAKTGNLPGKCPVDKDYHFVFNNVTIDAEQFPTYVPETRFAINLRFTEGNTFLLHTEIYGTVVQKSKNRWG